MMTVFVFALFTLAVFVLYRTDELWVDDMDSHTEHHDNFYS